VLEQKGASSTARLIAASLVFMHEHVEFAQSVSAESAELSRHFLRNSSESSRLFLNVARRRWFYHLASIIEQLTIPGILRHYGLRKKFLSSVVREARADGIKQMVVLGAGFDPLALELHRQFEDVHFWEIDHPATQQDKTRGVDFNVRRLHFVPADLQHAKIDAALLVDFNPAERSIWIAEGVLMYLPAQIVKEQFQAIRNLSAPGSRFAFTFMEPQRDGRIRFRKQTRLVDWWLKARGEQFCWGINREELAGFILPWRPVRIVDDAGLRDISALPPDIDLAAGELICLAELS
jgi:methyltransferase (TIGR00027 family)